MASGEIDINGLDKDLKRVDKTIQSIETSYTRFAGRLNEKQGAQLEKQISSSLKLLDKLQEKLEKAPSATGFDKVKDSMTDLAKRLSNVQSIFNGMDTKSAQEQIEQLKTSMKGLGEAMTANVVNPIRKDKLIANFDKVLKEANDEIIKTAAGKQSSAIIHNERERLLNLEAPKISGVTTKQLKDIIEAKTNIDQTRQSLKQLEEEYANLITLSSKSGNTNLGKAQSQLKKDITATRRELEKYENVLAKDKTDAAWQQYRNSAKDIVLYYTQVNNYVEKIKSRLAELQSAHEKYQAVSGELLELQKEKKTDTKTYRSLLGKKGGLTKSEEEYQALSAEKNLFEKQIAPIKEIAQLEIERQKRIKETVPTHAQELRLIEQKKAKEKEYLKLTEQLAARDQNLTPLQRAVKLAEEQYNIRKKIIELGRQAQNTGNVDELKAIIGQQKALNARLVDTYSQLDAITRKYPVINQIRNDSKEFGFSDNEDVLKSHKAIVDVENRLKSITELQRQMKRVAAGKIDSIGDYINQQPSIERHQKAINAMREAQQKLNLEAEGGVNRYRELEKEIQRLQKRLENLTKKASFDALPEHQKLLNAVQKGNLDAVDKYVGGDGAIKSINRYQNAINSLVNLQNKLNLGTDVGQKKYKELSEKIRQLTEEMNKLAGSQGRANQQLQQGNGLLSAAKGHLNNLLGAFGIFMGVYGFASFLKNVVKTTAEFERQKEALKQIVGDAREANVLFKRMSTLATESPMQLMDLNKYAKQLAAFKIETQELYGSLKMLGDISVGVGVDMSRLILAYGQVKAANYLRGQELRQFSEAGVNVLGGLQQYYQEARGITYSLDEIFDMVSKRKVVFEDVDAVLKNMTSEGGAFFNMQLKMSQTVYGQIQKISDLFKIALNEIGESSYGLIMGVVKALQWIVKHLTTIAKIGTLIGSTLYAMKLTTWSILMYENLMKKGIKEFLLNLRLSTYYAKKLNVELATAQRLAKGATIAGAVVAGLEIIFEVVSRLHSAGEEASKDTADAIKTLYDRIGDIRDIENNWNNTTAYEERLALLQQLVEKAKEWNYYLDLPEHIDSSNIDETFNKALYDLEMFNNRVMAFRSFFSDVLNDEELKDMIGGLTPAFAEAFEHARTLENMLKKAFNGLPEDAKKELKEIEKMTEAYRKDEQAAMKEYNMTREQMQDEYIERIAKLYKKASTETAIPMYFDRNGITFITELSDEVKKELTDVEQKMAEAAYDGIQEGYEDASTKFYDKFAVKVEEALKKANLKGVFDSLSKKPLAEMSDEELDEFNQKARETMVPIMEVFKEFPEIVHSSLINILAMLNGIDAEALLHVYIAYKTGQSDVLNTEYQKAFEEMLNEDKEINKTVNIRFTTKVKDEKTGEYKDVTKLTDVVNDVVSPNDKNSAKLKKEIQAIYDTSDKTAKGLKKGYKDLEKLAVETQKRFRDIINSGKDAAEKLRLLNLQLGTSFASAAEGLEYFQQEERIANRIIELNTWKDYKTSGGGRTSYLDDFKKMIEFIKKLHEEYKGLRKSFNDESAFGYSGAFNRVLNARFAEFKDMPKEFKEIFKEIYNISFRTEEEAVASMEKVRELVMKTTKLNSKERQEMLRFISDLEGDLLKKVELDKKALFDEKLFKEVQKMFDDYNLTLELKKLNVSGDVAGQLFGLETKTLSQLMQKVMDMQEQFIGTDAEKKYRDYLKKVQDMNDKANLEASKKYLKYLEKEVNEMARVQLEYMRMRAEIQALPLDDASKSRMIENLQKEEDKKLDKLKLDEFRATDFYIELFEDLEVATTSSIQTMLSRINDLKGSLKELSPTELKTINDQIKKLEETLLNRNPFSGLSKSLKELKELKADKDIKGLVEAFGSTDRVNYKNVTKALDVVEDKLNKSQKAAEALNLALGIAKQRDNTKESLLGLGVEEKLAQQISEDDEEGLAATAAEYQARIEALNEEIATNKDLTEDQINGYKQQVQNLREQIALINDLIEAYKTMSAVSKDENMPIVVGKSTSAQTIGGALDETNADVKKNKSDRDDLRDWQERFEKVRKAVKNLATVMKSMSDNTKGTFDSIMDNLDYLGGETSELTDAWKEFGDTVFDTFSNIADMVSRTMDLIPPLVTGFATAGVEINSAMGIIGLIAEAIQLVITLISAIGKIHDSIISSKIEKIQDHLEGLQKTAEKLTETFENLYRTDKIDAFNAAILENMQLQKADLERSLELEKQKKKQDKDQIKSYQEEIEQIEEDTISQIENFYNTVGGLGSAADMKSMAEEWTDAWYSAFKETGDGLSGLEESFDDFMDNIFKKQILNKLADKYFTELYEQLNYILAKSGGISENRDEFSSWVNQMQTAFAEFDNEAQQLAEVMMAAGGLGGSLDGLTASIQGMTEDTADIIAAYLNSIRFYVSGNSSQIEALQQGLCVDNNTNPIIMQLKIIAAQTTSLNTLVDSVIKPTGHNEGGAYIKVRVG